MPRQLKACNRILHVCQSTPCARRDSRRSYIVSLKQVTARKNAEEALAWLEAESISDELGGRCGALRAILRGLMTAGSKSFTHMLIALERYDTVLTTLLKDAGQQASMHSSLHPVPSEHRPPLDPQTTCSVLPCCLSEDYISSVALQLHICREVHKLYEGLADGSQHHRRLASATAGVLLQYVTGCLA